MPTEEITTEEFIKRVYGDPKRKIKTETSTRHYDDDGNVFYTKHESTAYVINEGDMTDKEKDDMWKMLMAADKKAKSKK